ncbi:major egg antigen-like [Penaeus japonicus]|uniref:major egg antigen-like n=1 Tax=Penaeus japonicus TaxID=27405 RepID=UPI001C70D94B|nr:major egg antigen-like [Penaeus japonicus]
MVIVRITRSAPGILRVVRTSARGVGPRLPLAPACSRCLHRGPFGGSDNPFSKMEEFMRDMERKFRRDIEDTVSTLSRDMPRGLVPRVWDVAPRPRFGDVKNMSTPETYKLAFYLKNAKPEDVTVTLKDHTLTVSAKIEETTETSRSSQNFTMHQDLPEGLNLDALESSMSDDGLLTIEAPQPIQEDTKGPKTIHIQRESSE